MSCIKSWSRKAKNYFDNTFKTALIYFKEAYIKWWHYTTSDVGWNLISLCKLTKFFHSQWLNDLLCATTLTTGQHWPATCTTCQPLGRFSNLGHLKEKKKLLIWNITYLSKPFITCPRHGTFHLSSHKKTFIKKLYFKLKQITQWSITCI